jgi:hypothetical protein
MAQAAMFSIYQRTATSSGSSKILVACFRIRDDWDCLFFELKDAFCGVSCHKTSKLLSSEK